VFFLYFFIAFVLMFLFSHERQINAFGGSAKFYVLLIFDVAVALAVAAVLTKIID